MIDYHFYKTIYMGDVIPEPDFSSLMKRSEEQMSRYRCMYLVDTCQGSTEEEMALCAMAEVLYCGGWSVAQESGRQTAEPLLCGSAVVQMTDTLPERVALDLFLAARLYIDIYTG